MRKCYLKQCPQFFASNPSSVSKSLFPSSVTTQHLLPGVKVWYVVFALIGASTEEQMECWAILLCLRKTLIKSISYNFPIPLRFPSLTFSCLWFFCLISSAIWLWAPPHTPPHPLFISMFSLPFMSVWTHRLPMQRDAMQPACPPCTLAQGWMLINAMCSGRECIRALCVTTAASFFGFSPWTSYIRDFTAALHFIMFELTARERQQLSAVPSFGSVIDGFCLAGRLCHSRTVNVMTPLCRE